MGMGRSENKRRWEYELPITMGKMSTKLFTVVDLHWALDQSIITDITFRMMTLEIGLLV